MYYLINRSQFYFAKPYLFIIGTRQHYTVDTLLAIIAGYWNFIWHLYVLRPHDKDVPISSARCQYQNTIKRRYSNPKQDCLEDQTDPSL